MADPLHRDHLLAPRPAAANPCWALVVPRQDVVVRLNGHDPDASPLDYLPAVRPYGVVAMARALRREIPGLRTGAALRIAWCARRGERAVAAVGTHGFLDDVRVRLHAFHALVSTIEPT